MSDDTQQPIVVKRIKKGGGGHHGGAWKIAYADFVTAMMAFFLLMWLLGSSAQGDLQGIAEFFQNPLRVGLDQGSGAGDSSSILKGGGEDLTRSLGQVKRGDVEGKRTVNLDAAKGREPEKSVKEEEAEAVAERLERARLTDLKGQIEALVEASSTLRALKNQLIMDITLEGLRIQIVDEKNRPMFDSASDQIKPYTRELLQEIGRALNQVRNGVSLSGHTDASQYAGGQKGFSNWELSANRANASRRELVAGGLQADRIVRVVGLADTVPFKPDDPADPINRRISIVVLNQKAEKAMRSSPDLEVHSSANIPAVESAAKAVPPESESRAVGPRPEPPSNWEYVPRFRRDRGEPRG